MAVQTDTVVVGAGQAGLSASYYLTQRGIAHVVLERTRIADSWHRRWDSFTLVTPNRLNALPNFPSGGKSDGFLSRAEVIDYLERFAASFAPPIRVGVTVTAVTQQPDRTFVVETSAGPMTARNVIIATNLFQTPRLPAIAAALPHELVQIHSDAYRNPAQLPPGNVVVVGSGQSGAQIADELHRAGRGVVLAVSRAGRLPRRYRNRDIMDWIRIFKGWEQTVDTLGSLAERTAARPHITGQAGGRTLDLRAFGRAGIELVGRVTGAHGATLELADDLVANLAHADEVARDMCAAIDKVVVKLDLEVDDPSPAETEVHDWEPPSVLRELDLHAAGITAIVWATGYPFSFAWITGLTFDAYGYPDHQRGVTGLSGLYFASLPWLHKHKSSSLYGAAEDAEYVVAHLAARVD